MATQTRLRLLIVALVAVLAFLLWLAYSPTALLYSLQWIGFPAEPTRGPTPPAPTLTAPQGALPTGHAGLEEWAHTAGQEARRVGSGFLLQLPSGPVIGVTTAHSLLLSAAPTVHFRLPQATAALIIFDDFYGPPGVTFTGYNFNVDFVFLQAAEMPRDAPVLMPDTRGLPELGERVVLYSGLGDGQGQPRALWGTITAASPQAVWAQMDDVFVADGMSGSPLLSAHTGQVVGMAVSATNSAPILLGFHPIGSLVEKAEAVKP